MTSTTTTTAAVFVAALIAGTAAAAPPPPAVGGGDRRIIIPVCAYGELLRWGGAAGWWCDGTEYRAVRDGYADDLDAITAAAQAITVPPLPAAQGAVPSPWTAPPRPPAPPPPVVDPPPVSPPPVTPPAALPGYDCVAVTVTAYWGCQFGWETFVVVDGPHHGLTGTQCAARGSAADAPAGIAPIYRVYYPAGFFGLAPYDRDATPEPGGAECGERITPTQWSLDAPGHRLLPLAEFLRAIDIGGRWWAVGIGGNAGHNWGGTPTCAPGSDC